MSTHSSPQPREFKKPVAWLLGDQLLNSLKGILLYSAYGGKIDPRDWMTGRAFKYSWSGKDWQCEALPIPLPSNATNDEPKLVVKTATPNQAESGPPQEFWFDYLSDSGDGMKAMYSIAYLALSDLRFNQKTAAVGQKTKIADSPDVVELPRGQFLFFGGDTAYHAAEYMSLIQRIQKTFGYAHDDLHREGLISEARRNIFGVPGNHDYYDQLDGFRRQFRKPVRLEGPPGPGDDPRKFAQLSIPGFQRIQEASYVAISLPFNWWLWGLDVESPVSDRHKINIDRRQVGFFRSLSQENKEFRSPDKLIVATCAPSTVLGRLADPKDPKVAVALKDVGLTCPFLPVAGKDVAKGTGDNQLSTGQCRLDLSGDVHHYARYWGPDNGVASREKSAAPKVSAESYASVVSGAGGAFHHPSTTDAGEICEQVLYPTEQVSREEVAKSIFKFWSIFNGGYVFLFGFIIAFVIYLGAAVTPSSKQFLSQFRVLRALNLTTQGPVTPTVLRPGVEPCAVVHPLKLWSALGVVNEVWNPPSDCAKSGYSYFFSGPDKWPLDLILGQILTILSFLMIGATLALAATKFVFTDESPFNASSKDPAIIIWPILIVTTILSVLGLSSLEPYRNYFTPFTSSLLVLYSIVAAATAIVLGLRYGEYRYRKSFVDGSASKSLVWFCWVLAIAVLGFALLLFGRNNPPAFLISDIMFVLVLVIASIAIVFLLPFLVAADLLYGRPGFVAVPGKLLIGLWHMILQLFVPFILVRNGNYVVWFLAVGLLFASLLAQPLLKKNWRAFLVIAWIGYGSVMLFLPKLVSRFYDGGYHPVVENLTGWLGLVAALIAGIFGAVICCLWTGWYFAVCFAFNGHNNEVGGAARIERFKEFVRFRLTKDGLTGYVIAVDDVDIINQKDANGRVMDGSDLKPKIIDVFHLVPKP